MGGAAEQVYLAFSAVQRRFYAGEATASEIEALMTADVSWHVPGTCAIAGDYYGRDEVTAYFEHRRDLAQSTFAIELRRLLADDEYGLTLADGRAEFGGRVREWQTVGLYRVQGRRIAQGRLIPFDQAVFDEIWP